MNPFDEIEKALEAANTILPGILGNLAPFVPQIKAIMPFLSLLPVAINAVKTVQQATGGNNANAAAAIVAHLTPGQTAAPALAPDAAPKT